MSPLILSLLLLAQPEDSPPPKPVDVKAFEGKWSLIGDNREGGSFGAQQREMTVKDGVLTEWWDGKRKKMQVQLKPAQPWPVIERAIFPQTRERHEGGGGAASGNVVWWQHGIYRLEGNTLTFALVNEYTPLPDSFEPKDNVAIEVWRREPKPRTLGKTSP